MQGAVLFVRIADRADQGVGAFGAPAVEVTGTPSRAHLLWPSGQPGGAVLVLATDVGVTG